MHVSDNALADNATQIRRKIVGPAVGGGKRAFMDFQAQPFHELAARDLLDTADLCRIFGCSARTVYGWVTERALTPTFKGARESLFTKSDLCPCRPATRHSPGRSA